MFYIRIYLIVSITALMLAAVFIFVLKEQKPKSDTLLLEISNTISGRTYTKRSVKTGDEFAIEFIHSVNKNPVREIFKIEDGMIHISAVRFYSYGAGMQTELEEGQMISRDGDAMIISGFNRAFTELNYIIGTESDHLLLINGRSISLRSLCGKNAHITIKIIMPE
jgi:hypothetical protein